MYIDADLIFALLKPNDRHAFFANKIIQPAKEIYTSVITLVELEIVVKRELSDQLSQSILNIVLQKIPQLKIIPLNKKDFAKSLELRQQFGLGIFDAIHAAVALSKSKKIASTDHAFDRIPGLKRMQ